MATGKDNLPIKDEFIWDEQRDKAAVLLAQGYNNSETAREVGVHKSTIGRWLENGEFEKAVDELSVTYGLASKAHRLRLLNKAIRQKTDAEGDIDLSGVSFIELIREARMQTEGLRLGLLNEIISVEEETGTLAGGRSEGIRSLPGPETQESD